MAPKLGAEPRDLPIPRAAGQNTWRRLAREAMLAALSTWFAVVAITAVPSLRPQQIRPQQPPNGSAYLDDFGVFYSASSLLMRGDGEGVYRLDAMQAAERETYGLQPDEFEALPFFNPPQALLLFAPLSMLRAPWAAAVWMAGTLLMAAAGLWLLLRAYPLRMRSLPTACLALGIVSSLPVYQAAIHGQISFLLVFGVSLLYVSMQRHDAKLSVPGLLILSLKPQLLLLPLVLFVVQRRYREIAITFAAGLAVLLVALSLSGVHALVDYVRLLVASTAWNGENGISTVGMFGWVGMVSGIMGNQAAEAERAAVLVLDSLTLALAAWAIWWGVRGERNQATLLSIALTGSLIASPHFYAQDLLLLVPLLLVMMHTYAPRDRSPAEIAVFLGVAGWFTVYIHFTVLGNSHINITTLYLLGLLATLVFALAGFIGGQRRTAHRRALRQSRPDQPAPLPR